KIAGDKLDYSLVNTVEIARYIIAHDGKLPDITPENLNIFQLKAKTISGKIEGITYNIPGINYQIVRYMPETVVYCNDPLSEPVRVTDPDGYYTINNVAPGKDYSVTVISDYHISKTKSGIEAGQKMLNFKMEAEHYLQ